MAEALGGEDITSTGRKQLADDDTLLSQLTVRCGTFADSTSKASFGGNDVTTTANRHGYWKTEESYTFGPFDRGGIRVKDIYIISTASADDIMWNGIPA